MKKTLCILLTLCLCLPCIGAIAEEKPISVTVDGTLLHFDQPPLLENDRTLVPMRAIFEALGCMVSYYEDGETQTVYANSGSKAVLLQIGADEMYVDGQMLALDVPAKIVNDRTLVPLRAVSEALDASVLWIESENAVQIESRQGYHPISNAWLPGVNIEGHPGLRMEACYPVIAANGDAYLEKINAEYKAEAEETFVYGQTLYKEMLAEYDGEDFIDFNIEVSIFSEVTLDRQNLLSINTYTYQYTGGAHPLTAKTSRVFDLQAKKELALADIVDTGKLNLEKAVLEGIQAYLGEDTEAEFVTPILEAVKTELGNASCFLAEDGLVVYFSQYQVGPYAIGMPEAKIPYNADAFKVDLSGYDEAEFTFEIDGNPTTGYEWVETEKSDRIAVQSHYIEPNTNLLGAGGIYRYTVRGVTSGNAVLTLSYIRPWEAEALQTKTYHFRVEPDLGVTLLGVE